MGSFGTPIFREQNNDKVVIAFMNKYYVYALYDPRQSPPTCIYVGKGCGDRATKHQIIASSTTISFQNQQRQNPFLYNTLKKILKSGYSIPYHIMCKNLSEEDAYTVEKQLIFMCGRRHNDSGFLLNLQEGGFGPPSAKGRVVSAATRYKISQRQIGKTVSLETRRRQSEARKGKRNTPAARLKISQANRGNKHTQITKQKISLANTGKKRTQETKNKIKASKAGSNHPNFGKHLSVITKHRIRMSQIGKKMSKGSCAKMSAAQSGSKNNTYTYYIVVTPENKILKFGGVQHVSQYFTTLSDNLKLKGRNRIGGNQIVESGFSQGYTLLRKYKPNQNKHINCVVA